MTTLFIDTTKYITVGLLDKNLNWLDYSFYKELKASAAIHFKIYSVLDKYNLSIEEVDQVVYMAGPGSYTGMRVSAGIAQVFDFSGLKTYSIFHYEVPEILGIKEGKWCSDAFKREDFLYSWSLTGHKTELICKDQNLNKEGFFTAFDFENTASATDILIKENSKAIFRFIIENKLKRDLYYYRPLEEEFGVIK